MPPEGAATILKYNEQEIPIFCNVVPLVRTIDLRRYFQIVSISFLM